MSKFQAFKGNILTKQQKQQTKAGKGKLNHPALKVQGFCARTESPL